VVQELESVVWVSLSLESAISAALETALVASVGQE
jgi:hypothetical protein